MSKTKSSYAPPLGDFERPRHKSSRDNVLRNRFAVAPRRPPGEDGQKTTLYLTLETDDLSVLGAIRAALPEGSRLHVRFAKDAPFAPRGTTGYASTGLSELTTRQRDILALLVEGLSNKEIGRRLSLSHFTVRNHISQVMRRLDASTRSEIVAKFKGATIASTPGMGLAAK